MRANRYLPTHWWINHEFLGLTPMARRVLFALWTAPETPTCGITTVGAATVADRLRTSGKVVQSALVELSQAGFISLDHDSAVIWLHNFLERQLGSLPAKSQRWIAATADALRNLPDTALTRRFRAHYSIPVDALAIPRRYPIDTLSIHYRYPQ